MLGGGADVVGVALLAGVGFGREAGVVCATATAHVAVAVTAVRIVAMRMISSSVT
jgi:hypothetical protein